MSNLNSVDFIILLVFLASILAGLVRGFVKEVLSLITWIAAIVIAVMFSTKLAAVFTGSQQVQSVVSSASQSIGMNTAHPVSILSIGISFIILFAVTLMIGSIISSLTSRAVEGGGISFINRILGAVFGLARGFLIVLVVIFLLQLTPLQQQPWWTQSQFVNSFQPAVKQLSDYVSPQLESLKTKVSNSIQNPGQLLHDVTGTGDSTTTTTTTTTK